MSLDYDAMRGLDDSADRLFSGILIRQLARVPLCFGKRPSSAHTM